MIREMTEVEIESQELARRIVDLFSDRQAEDVVLLDIHRVAGFADYFVIASAQNPRHMRALIDAMDKDLRREGIKYMRSEGDPDSGWILVDFGDVIAHIFTAPERAFYNLEGSWNKAGVPAVRFQ